MHALCWRLENVLRNTVHIQVPRRMYHNLPWNYKFRDRLKQGTYWWTCGYDLPCDSCPPDLLPVLTSFVAESPCKVSSVEPYLSTDHLCVRLLVNNLSSHW